MTGRECSHLLAVASLVLGNLTAIAQSNLKRMLAYSTIAQMGFVLLAMLSGVVAGNAVSIANSYSAAMFYLISYALTTLGTFGIMLLLARQGFEAEEIADLRGLAKRSPWYAFVMLLLMFSLAGVPPTVGFYAKLVVLQALLGEGCNVAAVLAVIAVLFSLIAAFYYLRVVKVMYFDEPTAEAAATDRCADRHARGALGQRDTGTGARYSSAVLAEAVRERDDPHARWLTLSLDASRTVTIRCPSRRSTAGSHFRASFCGSMSIACDRRTVTSARASMCGIPARS